MNKTKYLASIIYVDAFRINVVIKIITFVMVIKLVNSEDSIKIKSDK